MTKFVAMIFLSLVQAIHAEDICPLCESEGTIPVRMEYHVGGGETCLTKYLSIAELDPNSQACRSQQSTYREMCCGDDEPPSIPSAPPVYSGPTGNEPLCPICRTMEYPGIPSAIVNARYVGDFSCSQLYDRGMHGLISWNMCPSLQDFAYSVCGCGEHNPKCQQDRSQCWPDPPPRNNPQPSFPNPPNASPVSMPISDFAPTTLNNRKVRPKTGKTGARMAGRRGGAAGRLRAGNRHQLGRG